jgi:hypothetical protein
MKVVRFPGRKKSGPENIHTDLVRGIQNTSEAQAGRFMDVPAPHSRFSAGHPADTKPE